MKIEHLECLNQSNTTQGSNASFAIKEERQPVDQPGQRPSIAVSTAISLNFKTDQGRNFIPGKKYSITIEEEQ